LTTLREFTLENAELALEVARKGLPLPDAIKVVDMSLAYDLAYQSEENRRLTDLIGQWINEEGTDDERTATGS
jgi:hypothetical protein